MLFFLPIQPTRIEVTGTNSLSSRSIDPVEWNHKELIIMLEPTKLLLRGSERVRVIYGHAGIGKTTLLKQVCRTLAKKEASTEYSQVLYFPLREKKVSQAKDLRELFSYYGSEDQNLDHSAAVQPLIDKQGEEYTGFIFDGADESQRAT